MGKGEMGISETGVGEMGKSLFFTKNNSFGQISQCISIKVVIITYLGQRQKSA